MSQIMQESNTPPSKIYYEWGRWRVVRCTHTDSKKNKDIDQYALQRYSDNKRFGKVWHLCCFFWSIEDLDDFISNLQAAADSIEDMDLDHILHRADTNDREG